MKVLYVHKLANFNAMMQYNGEQRSYKILHLLQWKGYFVNKQNERERKKYKREGEYIFVGVTMMKYTKGLNDPNRIFIDKW